MATLDERMEAYEAAELGLDDILALFQDLLDSGVCWQRGPAYAEVATRLVDTGLVHLPDLCPMAAGRYCPPHDPALRWP